MNINIIITPRNPNDVNLESEAGGGSGGNSAGSRLSSDKSISKSKVVEWPHYDPLYKKYLTIGKFI